MPGSPPGRSQGAGMTVQMIGFTDSPKSAAVKGAVYKLAPQGVGIPHSPRPLRRGFSLPGEV
jgi:hypothetical protein